MEATIEPVREMAYNTSLITLWILMLTVFPLITRVFKSKRTNWGNFWKVWFWSAVISGIFVTFIIVSPNIIVASIEWFKTFFGV